MSSTNRVPKSALQAFTESDVQMFPNIYKIIKILCTLPVSTTTPELMFSTLKRVKTYLRNTMCEVNIKNASILCTVIK